MKIYSEDPDTNNEPSKKQKPYQLFVLIIAVMLILITAAKGANRTDRRTIKKRSNQYYLAILLVNFLSDRSVEWNWTDKNSPRSNLFMSNDHLTAI
jgi:hypothetical protein